MTYTQFVVNGNIEVNVAEARVEFPFSKSKTMFRTLNFVDKF